MKCIAVGNKKGGVGKSTIVVNLASEFPTRHRTVTVLDTDEQGTASDWCSRGNLPIHCEHFPIDNQETARRLIQHVKAATTDIVILDLPPHTREAAEAAIAVCDLFLIPVSPSGADFVSTSKALELIHKGRALRQGEPKVMLVPSRVDRRTSFGKEILEALQGFSETIGPVIVQRSLHVDCYGLADWVGHAYPRSPAYEEIKALTDAIEEMIPCPKAV